MSQEISDNDQLVSQKKSHQGDFGLAVLFVFTFILSVIGNYILFEASANLWRLSERVLMTEAGQFWSSTSVIICLAVAVWGLFYLLSRLRIKILNYIGNEFAGDQTQTQNWRIRLGHYIASPVMRAWFDLLVSPFYVMLAYFIHPILSSHLLLWFAILFLHPLIGPKHPRLYANSSKMIYYLSFVFMFVGGLYFYFRHEISGGATILVLFLAWRCFAPLYVVIRQGVE